MLSRYDPEGSGQSQGGGQVDGVELTFSQLTTPVLLNLLKNLKCTGDMEPPGLMVAASVMYMKKIF